jgi:hypothetical protein
MPDHDDDYDPTLYTLEGVNKGQRKINYALTVADKKIVDVLLAVKEALSGPPGQIQSHVPQIQAKIEEASKAIKHVASIRPPGCDYTWTPEPDPDPNPTRG